MWKHWRQTGKHLSSPAVVGQMEPVINKILRIHIIVILTARNTILVFLMAHQCFHVPIIATTTKIDETATGLMMERRPVAIKFKWDYE